MWKTRVILHRTLGNALEKRTLLTWWGRMSWQGKEKHTTTDDGGLLKDKSDKEKDDNAVYPGHIATNLAQKIALSIGSGAYGENYGKFHPD